jgi:putative oxidoreductase
MTPLGVAALSGTMITAIRTVHLDKGPWVSQGGYEYNLVLIASLLALAEAGPGCISFDHVAGREMSGLPWALGALVVGAAGSELVLRSSRDPAGQLA